MYLFSSTMVFLGENVPNINKFGAAKRPNIKDSGVRGGPSEGGLFWRTLSLSLEIIYVYGFCFVFKLLVIALICSRRSSGRVARTFCKELEPRRFLLSRKDVTKCQ